MQLFLFIVLPLVLVGLGIFAPLWNAARSESERERTVAIRMTIFSWMIGLTLVGALLLMPNKSRVLMMAPIFIAAVLLGQLWKRARLRARRERELAVNLERMKRAN